MAAAQFIKIPPLERITQLFTFITGQPFEPLVSWSAWQQPTTSDLDWFQAYIRPCHQKIIREVRAGSVPCAFLRQLLRPYGYYIEAKGGSWSLRKGSVETTVREGGEKFIEWL